MIKPKTKQEIEHMREGGAMLAELRRALMAMVKPGITTQSLEDFAHAWMREKSVVPSFLGFQKYPAVLCVSINDQAVHAVPSNRVIMEGDLVKIDLGIIHRGLHTDTAATVLATEWGTPKIPRQKEYVLKRKLISTAEQALDAGIAVARAGNTIGDISEAIQRVIEENGFKVLKELGGHGIGKNLHEEPFVPNYRDAEYNQELFPGMTIALEPIPSVGTARIEDGDDGFAFVTSDGSLSSHAEHTIVITEKEPIIVTE